MRMFLKVSAVLVLSFGAYYLLMGLTMCTSSGQVAQIALEMDETADAALVAQAATELGVVMLIIGAVECLAGLFGLLGGKRRGLLIAALALGAVMLASSLYTLATSPFEPMLLVDLALPVLLIIPALAVLRMGPEAPDRPPRLGR